MKIVHRRDYAEARRESYPPIGDQLDVLWKFLQTQTLPSETKSMLDRVLKVKATYPKG